MRVWENNEKGWKLNKNAANRRKGTWRSACPTLGLKQGKTWRKECYGRIRWSEKERKEKGVPGIIENANLYWRHGAWARTSRSCVCMQLTAVLLYLYGSVYSYYITIYSYRCIYVYMYVRHRRAAAARIRSQTRASRTYRRSRSAVEEGAVTSGRTANRVQLSLFPATWYMSNEDKKPTALVSLCHSLSRSIFLFSAPSPHCTTLDFVDRYSDEKRHCHRSFINLRITPCHLFAKCNACNFHASRDNIDYLGTKAQAVIVQQKKNESVTKRAKPESFSTNWHSNQFVLDHHLHWFAVLIEVTDPNQGQFVLAYVFSQHKFKSTGQKYEPKQISDTKYASRSSELEKWEWKILI